MLWAHVGLLPVFALLREAPLAHALGEGAVVAAFALVGTRAPQHSHRLAATAVSLA